MDPSLWIALFVWFALAGGWYTIEFHAGMDRGDEEVTKTLRKLWCGVPERDFANFAYHEAPEPNRSHLRRSAYANLLGLVPWCIGAAYLGAWYLYLPAIAYGVYVATLLRPAPIR